MRRLFSIDLFCEPDECVIIPETWSVPDSTAMVEKRKPRTIRMDMIFFLLFNVTNENILIL